MVEKQEEYKAEDDCQIEKVDIYEEFYEHWFCF